MAEVPTITISGATYRVVTQLTDTPTHRSFQIEREGRSFFLKVFRKEAAATFDKQFAALENVNRDSGLLLPIESGEFNDERFVLRKWIDGESFDGFARRFKFNPKRLDDALAIGEKLARAVAPLHKEGIAHGRIKNENVFIDADGDPLITDPTGTGVPRDDVRQIGLLLCRLYTRKPTLAMNSRTLMELSKVKVPMSLLKVLWQAIQDEPSQRFKDAGTLATALEEVPLKEHEKTVHVRAVPNTIGPSTGVPNWLRNMAIFIGILGVIAIGSWFFGMGDVPIEASSPQAALGLEGTSTSSASTPLPISVPPTQTAQNNLPPAGLVRVIYYRYDNAYDRPGLWIWNPDKQDTIDAREVFPISTTSEGAVFEIRLADLGVGNQQGERIGIIPRLQSNWENKDGNDRFWIPTLGNMVWLVQGENTVYTNPPILEPAVKRALLEDERTVRFITNRPMTDAVLNNPRNFRVTSSSRSIEPSQVLPVRDGTGTAVSALATFPSALYPLPPQSMALIEGMQPAPLLLGAIQKNPSIFSIDKPMGVSFSESDVTFRVFAANAERVDVEVFSGLNEASPSRILPMIRGQKGMWEASITRTEAEENYYAYSVSLYGGAEPTRITDPAAINHVARLDRTRITDPRSTDPPGFRPLQRPAFSGDIKDAIIYELHVQGFTAGGATSHREPGTYLGLVELGTTLSTDRAVMTGIDHLKELGVTHVQLMPVSEFVPAPGSQDGYDWGYWPLAWMSPRGDFASSKEGNARLREFKQMVQSLHAQRIGVIVDLPLAQLSAQSSIEALAPGAFTFLEANGRPATIADQAYRIDSSAPAARALMLQTVRFWMEEMGVDGVRLEALGHIDLNTAEEILATAKSINPNALVYGTPWGTGPSPHGQVTDKTLLAATGIAAYNDSYRNTLKGQPSGNGNGYIQEPRRFAREIEDHIQGSVNQFTTSSNDVINMLTDHDGCTLWDKIKATTNLPEQEQMKLQLLAQGILLVSQGGVLLSGGDELFWSRNGQCWGWEAGLRVNIMPWDNKSQYQFASDYMAGLIALRVEHPAFRLGSAEAIQERLGFVPEQQLPNPACVAFTIKATGLEGEEWSSVFVVINPTGEAQAFQLPDAQTWQVFVENGRASITPLSVATGQMRVPARTLAVIGR